MKSKIIITTLATFLFTFTAQPAFATMLLFTNENCPHCERLQSNMDEENITAKLDIEIYEISQNPQNMALYLQKSKDTGYKNGGVPLLIDGEKFIEGADPIFEYIEALVPKEESGENPTTALTTEDSKNLNAMIQESLENEDDSPQTSPADIDTKTGLPKTSPPKIVLIVGGVVLIISAILRLRKTPKTHKRK